LGNIRVAIAGLGNCASALIQGVEFYRHQKKGEIPGLMHVNFGGYYIDEIEFVAAFDVNSLKIGGGGVEPVNVADVLEESGADMLINYLPVGSAKGTKLYAQASLDVGCAFINCIPEFIASDDAWAKRFQEAELPVAGDDIKSQVGATILHRALAELFYDRGVHIDSMYQLNIGGNTDFQNMTVEERLRTKRVSKTEAVKSLISYDVPTRIGPSDYVPFLGDKKICYIRIQGKGFGNLPTHLSAKLEVHDSPNSAGVVIDVIRAVKLALDRGVSGPLTSISSYAFKHPPVQVTDDQARRWVEDFIEGKRER